MSTPITAAQAIEFLRSVKFIVPPSQDEGTLDAIIALLSTLTAPADAEVVDASPEHERFRAQINGTPFYYTTDCDAEASIKRIVNEYDILATALRAERAKGVDTTREACALAQAVYKNHYADNNSEVKWECADDAIGAILQISNMTAGLGAQVAALKARAEELEKERDAIAAVFDRAGLFMRFSMDKGETWNPYPLIDRVKMAVTGCSTLENESRERERVLVEALKTTAAQLKHVEELRVLNCGPTPSTLTPEILEQAAALSAAPVTRGEEVKP